jgi:hypothetical protein
MQDLVNAGATSLARQITERYGLLLLQVQLARLLGRSADGLRYSLKYPSVSSTSALKACGRKVGRRVYYLRKRGNLGRDGIYRPLRTFGYARFQRVRDKHGRIRGGIYFIREIADSPYPDLPDTVLPDTAAPGPANPGALPTADLNLIKNYYFDTDYYQNE